MRCAVLALGLALGAPSYLAAIAADSDATPPARVLFTIRAAQIDESSSLFNSGVQPGLTYTTNDSGDGPFVYALDHQGRLVGTTTLAHVDPVDIEALGGAPDGSLVVADIGDNGSSRGDVTLYLIRQPTAGDHVVTPDKVTLTYPDGARNAESVIYDSDTGRAFVVSKEVFGQVYETPADVFSSGKATLQPVADAPAYATDATFLPGREVVVVRTYRQAFAYGFPSWHLLTSFDLPRQRQGESVTGITKTLVWVGSEGTDSRVWSVPFDPAGLGPAADGGSTGGTGGRPVSMRATDRGGGGDDTVVRISGSAGLLVVVVGALVLLSWRRRRAGGGHPS